MNKNQYLTELFKQLNNGEISEEAYYCALMNMSDFVNEEEEEEEN